MYILQAMRRRMCVCVVVASVYVVCVCCVCVTRSSLVGVSRVSHVSRACGCKIGGYCTRFTSSASEFRCVCVSIGGRRGWR